MHNNLDSTTTKSVLEPHVICLPAPESIPESKICRELRNAREREVAKVISRHYQEIKARTKALRNRGIYEEPSCIREKGEKSPAQVIAAASIAEVVLPKKEVGGSGGSVMVDQVNLGKGKGCKPNEMKAVMGSALCAADLDDIYC